MNFTYEQAKKQVQYYLPRLFVYGFAVWYVSRLPIYNSLDMPLTIIFIAVIGVLLFMVPWDKYMVCDK